MKAYLLVFVNFKQNNWAKLLLIVKFAYNNAKNASTSHMPFELNYGYYFLFSFKKDNNPYLQSKIINNLSAK